MMFRYFIAYCRANKGKIAVLVLSIAVYYALAVTTIALSRSLPKIAALPFAKIGVQTVVQKTGKIPSRMAGAVFPHSNGPIYGDEESAVRALPFVRRSDDGLYFWYFDEDYFKSILGVGDGGIFSDLLKDDLSRGTYSLAGDDALVTEDFARKNGLGIGDGIAVGATTLNVRGILHPDVSGNIIPANIYTNLAAARAVVAASGEMPKLYGTGDRPYVNVVLLKADPNWSGDKETMIKKIDPDALVFSAKTFSKETADQLRLVSSLGQVGLAVLGLLLIVAFGLMSAYALKTRQGDIAVLRMIGWKLGDLRKHFFAENLIMAAVALAIGNALALVGLKIASMQKVRLELPWEVSAMPHFLPRENAIQRVVESPVPIAYDWRLFAAATLVFIVLLSAVHLLVFSRLKNSRPTDHRR